MLFLLYNSTEHQFQELFIHPFHKHYFYLFVKKEKKDVQDSLQIKILEYI